MGEEVELHHAEGVRAAIALITLAREKGAASEAAEKVETLMNYYIDELTPSELAVMTYTLVILAANPIDSNELRDLANKLQST